MSSSGSSLGSSSSGSEFEQDTQLIDQGRGLFSGHISKHWNIGENPNGGYLVATALRAVRTLSDQHPDPLSVTTHYLRPGLADEPCEVEVERVRTGRTMTTARARLIQQGKTRIEVLTAFGDLATAATTAHDDAVVTLPMPHIPPPAECPERSGVAQGVNLPILDRVEIKINPEDAPPSPEDSAQSTRLATGRAEISGWIRLRDQSPTDSTSAVMFTDAFPPALFGLLGVIGWVPTIELTVHMRRRPETPWLLGKFRTDDLHGGRMIESGALWDENGALVAQSRQLGLLLER